MEEYKIIGKIDLYKIGKYKHLINTDKVIITNERREHIFKRHKNDYDNIKKYLPNILYNPDYILEDSNNKDTIILLKEIISEGKKAKIIVKLNTKKEDNRYNSIITLWIIRDRDYIKAIQKCKIIFENLDKEE